jgi:RNA polymerase sigma factor (sigma-70 family)
MNAEIQLPAKIDRRLSLNAGKKHPEFDAYFAKHKGLIWMWATKLSELYRAEKDEFLGELTLRFNQVLFNYNPQVARFSTYFSYRLLSDFRKNRLRKSSDKIQAAWFDKKVNLFSEMHRDERADKEKQNFDVADEPTSWGQEFLMASGGSDVFWQQVESILDRREFYVISQYFREFRTVPDIAEEIGVTKQRIDQNKGNAIRKLREYFGVEQELTATA